jgi:hypothetical protein
MSLFLGLVKRAISAPPSADSLYDLLKLAKPDLTQTDIRTVAAREKLYKTLCSEIHPDKQVLQALTTFYESCADCDFNAKRREIIAGNEASPSKRSRPTLPNKFSVDEQWPTLMENLKNLNNLEYMKDTKVWIFGVRGHIVHYTFTGRLAGCVYTGDHAFHKLPSNDIDSIKEELMLHGPVLSTSFRPTDVSTDALKHLIQDYFLDKNTPSTVIILGWKQTDKGTDNKDKEVWLVRPTPQAEVMEVPIGSCCLADEVQIPQWDLRNWAWHFEKKFPFLERDLSGEAYWMTLADYDMALSEYEFKSLMQKLRTEDDPDIGEMLTAKRRIEICPVGVRAMSRRAEIVGLVCRADGWTLRTKFVDA